MRVALSRYKKRNLRLSGATLASWLLWSSLSWYKVVKLLHQARLAARCVVLVNDALYSSLIKGAKSFLNGLFASLAAEDQLLCLAYKGLNARAVHLVALLFALVRADALFSRV